jgi:hypothetical protein
MVAPPGASKSFWLQQFMGGDNSIIGKSIPCTFEATTTEAGWTGTLKSGNGDVVRVEGLAEQNKFHIVGIEEFSALSQMMEVSHSRTLDTQLLTSLDRGFVIKRLAGGKIDYETFVSLWAGVQPSRLDLAAGLGRRFSFIEFIPTKAEMKEMREKMRTSDNVRYDIERVKTIHEMIKYYRDSIRGVEEIRFDPTLYELFDDLKCFTFEELLFKKLALGFTIVNSDEIKSKIFIGRTTLLDSIIREAHMHRRNVARGSEFNEIILILEENNGKLTFTQLKDELLLYGLDWMKSTELINTMVRLRIIDRFEENIIYRPRKYKIKLEVQNTDGKPNGWSI